MFPYIARLGSFEIRVYSLMIMIAVLLTVVCVTRRAKLLGFNKLDVENLVLIGFFSGIVGARLYYVIFNWNHFKQKPLWEIFAVWHGGLAIHGGLILGVAVSLWYCYKKDIYIFKIGDIGAPFILLGQGIGRFGNFANGEAHGVPTITPLKIIFSLKPEFNSYWQTVLNTYHVKNTPAALTRFYEKITSAQYYVNYDGVTYILKKYVPWGVSFPAKYNSEAYKEFGSIPLHPTFFYEMILNTIGALILLTLWKKDENIGTGKIMGLYFIFYGLIRGFVTFFRADDLMFFSVRAPHVASVLLVGAGIIWMQVAKRHKKI